MAIKRYQDLEQARAAALQASLDKPGYYVHLFACFGLEVVVKKRLHVFAPSDAYGDTYWLNGKEKPFTEAQKAADWAATPSMS